MSTSATKRRRALRGGHVRCHYCPDIATTIDHIVPLGKGGSRQVWNEIPACGPCNTRKSSTLPDCFCAKCARAVHLWTIELESLVKEAYTLRKAYTRAW